MNEENEDQEFVDPCPTVYFKEVKKMVFVATCTRCGHNWQPRQEAQRIKSMPKQCPRCHSPYWNKPRLQRGEPNAINKYGFDEWEYNKWYPIPAFSTPEGQIDTIKNETYWRSLAQFARRKGGVAQYDSHTGKRYARIAVEIPAAKPVQNPS